MTGITEPSAPENPAEPATARGEALALAAGLLTVVLWSSNFPVIRYAIRDYSPDHLALLRCLFAAAALAVYAVAARMRLPEWRDWPVFIGFGVSGMALSSLGLAYGLETVSAGAGAFIIGTIPVFSALMARGFLAERLGGLGWAGIAVSAGGTALIALGEGEGLRVGWGVLFLLASAFCQSIFYVFQKPYLRRYSPIEITCYIVWSGALSLLVFLPGLPGELAAAGWGPTLALAYQGVFPVALAFVTWSVALKRAKAARVTSLVYLMPLLSTAIAYVWLAEVPAALSLLGGLTAIAGVAILNVWGK